MKLSRKIVRLWHRVFGYRCPICGGYGYVIFANGLEEECKECKGRGRTRNSFNSKPFHNAQWR